MRILNKKQFILFSVILFFFLISCSEQRSKYSEPDLYLKGDRVQNSIYFKNNLNRGWLYKYTIDTGEIECVLNQSINDITIEDNYLYCINEDKGNSVYQYDLSDGFWVRLNDDESRNLVCSDGKVYYIDQAKDNHIFYFDPSVRKEEEVTGFSVDYFDAYDDYIYYSNNVNDSEVMILSLIDKKAELNKRIVSRNYKITDDKIYYENVLANNCMYSYDLSTGDDKQLTDFAVDQIKLFGNDICFVGYIQNVDNIYLMDTDSEEYMIADEENFLYPDVAK